MAQPGSPQSGRVDAGSDGDRVFSALADPTRRRLLEEIARGGPRTATDLAAGWPVTRQAVSKHLGALAAAGLVESRRDGREVLYAVVPGRLSEATRWLEEVGRRWDERLASLYDRLAGERTDPA